MTYTDKKKQIHWQVADGGGEPVGQAPLECRYRKRGAVWIRKIKSFLWGKIDH